MRILLVEDDIPLEVKKRRLADIQDVQHQNSFDNNQKSVNKTP